MADEIGGLIAWLTEVLERAGSSQRAEADRQAFRLAKSIVESSPAGATPDPMVAEQVMLLVGEDAEETIRWIAYAYCDEDGWRAEWTPRMAGS